MTSTAPKPEIFRSLDEIPANFGPSVAVVGNFDGVHRGHRQVLGAVTAEAQARGYHSLAITFDPHPEHFLRPQSATGLIAPIPHRLQLLAATGVDTILVLPFDESLACLAARNCVRSIFVEKLGIRSIHEGHNFRFGYRAEAGIDELTAFGHEFGFTVTVHPPVEVHKRGGMAISSSAIRRLIAAGDLRRARWMLGHTFSIQSTPARGRGIGTRLLVPTINLAPYVGLLPAHGVYITRLTIGAGKNAHCFEAVTNIGIRPTFGEPSFAVESYLLDFNPETAPELTEETPLELEFLHYLRPELQWPNPESLKAQIMKDVARANRYHHLTKILNSPERNR